MRPTAAASAPPFAVRSRLLLYDLYGQLCTGRDPAGPQTAALHSAGRLGGVEGWQQHGCRREPHVGYSNERLGVREMSTPDDRDEPLSRHVVDTGGAAAAATKTPAASVPSSGRRNSRSRRRSGSAEQIASPRPFRKSSSQGGERRPSHSGGDAVSAPSTGRRQSLRRQSTGGNAIAHTSRRGSVRDSDQGSTRPSSRTAESILETSARWSGQEQFMKTDRWQVRKHLLQGGEAEDTAVQELEDKLEGLQQRCHRRMRAAEKRLVHLAMHGTPTMQLPRPAQTVLLEKIEQMMAGEVGEDDPCSKRLNAWLNKLSAGADEMTATFIRQQCGKIRKATETMGRISAKLEERHQGWWTRQMARKNSTTSWLLERTPMWRSDIFSVWYLCQIGDMNRLHKLFARFEAHVPKPKKNFTVHHLIRARSKFLHGSITEGQLANVSNVQTSIPHTASSPTQRAPILTNTRPEEDGEDEEDATMGVEERALPGLAETTWTDSTSRQGGGGGDDGSASAEIPPPLQAIGATDEKDITVLDLVNWPDPDFGWFPLHYACRRDHIDVVKHLVERGADISVRTPEGQTPLHTAALYSHKYVAFFLLENGALVDALDNEGRTPADAALRAHRLEMHASLQQWIKDEHGRRDWSAYVTVWAEDDADTQLSLGFLRLGRALKPFINSLGLGRAEPGTESGGSSDSAVPEDDCGPADATHGQVVADSDTPHLNLQSLERCSSLCSDVGGPANGSNVATETPNESAPAGLLGVAPHEDHAADLRRWKASFHVHASTQWAVLKLAQLYRQKDMLLDEVRVLRWLTLPFVHPRWAKVITEWLESTPLTLTSTGAHSGDVVPEESSASAEQQDHRGFAATATNDEQPSSLEIPRQLMRAMHRLCVAMELVARRLPSNSSGSAESQPTVSGTDMERRTTTLGLRRVEQEWCSPDLTRGGGDAVNARLASEWTRNDWLTLVALTLSKTGLMCRSLTRLVDARCRVTSENVDTMLDARVQTEKRFARVTKRLARRKRARDRRPGEVEQLVEEHTSLQARIRELDGPLALQNAQLDKFAALLALWRGEHVHVLRWRARILLELGRHTEVERDLEECLVIQEEQCASRARHATMLGVDGMELVPTLDLLIDAFRFQGKFGEAAFQHQRAMRIEASTFGDTSERAIRRYANLGTCMLRGGMYRDAHDVLEEGLARTRIAVQEVEDQVNAAQEEERARLDEIRANRSRRRAERNRLKRKKNSSTKGNSNARRDQTRAKQPASASQTAFRRSLPTPPTAPTRKNRSELPDGARPLPQIPGTGTVESTAPATPSCPVANATVPGEGDAGSAHEDADLPPESAGPATVEPVHPGANNGSTDDAEEDGVFHLLVQLGQLQKLQAQLTDDYSRAVVARAQETDPIAATSLLHRELCVHRPSHARVSMQRLQSGNRLDMSTAELLRKTYAPRLSQRQSHQSQTQSPPLSRMADTPVTDPLRDTAPPTPAAALLPAEHTNGSPHHMC